MSLVRSRDLAKQAGQAREIARRFNNTPAIFWGIMSNVMQAIYAPDASERDMYLSIASKTIEKSIQDKKFSSQEHMNLYLLLLDMQGQHDKAISIIHQDQGMVWYLHHISGMDIPIYLFIRTMPSYTIQQMPLGSGPSWLLIPIAIRNSLSSTLRQRTTSMQTNSPSP